MGTRQMTVWGSRNPVTQEKAWQVVDRINADLGRGTVRVGSAGPKIAAWNLRSHYRSPRATTCWEELAIVRG